MPVTIFENKKQQQIPKKFQITEVNILTLKFQSSENTL